jgi:hypothetical protein
MTTLTQADLSALGYRVVDGVAVKVGSGETEAARTKANVERKGAPARPLSNPYRSKWEAERADYHEAHRRAGLIRDWRYEAVRLKLADGAWYKSDFLVWATDGSLWLEEVKGFWREAARVRYKVAVSQYPMFGFTVVSKQKGQWVELESRCGGWLEIVLPPSGLRKGKQRRGAA